MDVRQKIAVGSIIAFLLMAGCQKNPLPKTTPAPTPLEERSVSVGGTDRSYQIYVPAKARTSDSVPVVLVFHSGGNQPETIAKITGFTRKADAEGFIVVYPRGSGTKQAADRFWWNGGLCCGPAQKNNIDDVAFIRALLDDLVRTLPVDGRRIFATGLDSGALLSFRLACEMADRIAAIGPVAGTQNVADCRPAQPVSVVYFHGTADAFIPYSGGVGKGTSNFSYASVKDTIGYWVTADQCPGTVVREESGPIVHETYGPCSNGSAVELYTIQDGTHNWPGNLQAGTRVAKATRGLNATDILWDFFVRHPMPEQAAYAVQTTHAQTVR
jgi:polyhydroxybutyrate depolymerase